MMPNSPTKISHPRERSGIRSLLVLHDHFQGRGIFSSYAQDPLCQAVESAWRAGIVVVAAAGNLGRISVNGSNGYGTE